MRKGPLCRPGRGIETPGQGLGRTRVAPPPPAEPLGLVTHGSGERHVQVLCGGLWTSALDRLLLLQPCGHRHMCSHRGTLGLESEARVGVLLLALYQSLPLPRGPR